MLKPFLGLRNPLFALSLTAIDPGLRGVIIGGPPGSGKSSLARAARVLWPQEVPFVNLPLGCTIDRLVGGIDLEASLRAGKPVINPGLLAQANGGVLYVDQINLLSPELLHPLLAALTTGRVSLEREGVSRTFAAQFTLIATFDPEEGSVPDAISDRVAFTVFTQTLRDLYTRAYIAERAGQGIIIPEDIVETVRVGRKILPEVQISQKALKELCTVASRTGVEGNRAEIFAVRCAKANAALHRRVPVTQGDIDLAIRLVYLPRVGSSVLPGSESIPDELLSQKTANSSAGSSQKPPDSRGGSSASGKENRAAEADIGSGSSHNRPNKRLRLPDDPEGAPGAKAVNLPPVSGRSAASRDRGRHLAGVNWRRGRHIRSVTASERIGILDLIATLKSAALASPFRDTSTASPKIVVRKSDLHIKQFRQRSGLLFVFAVDASGSMAINRLKTARSAAISLLNQAYVHRDKVALIVFRGKQAQLVLSPGGGIAKASHVLQSLPVGGRTPLSSALLKAYELASQARSRWQVSGTVLVLLTDAKANQPLKAVADPEQGRVAAAEEVKRLCGKLRAVLSAAVVFDARKIQVPNGRSQMLAQWLGAHYVFLQHASAQQITEIVRQEAIPLRE